MSKTMVKAKEVIDSPDAKVAMWAAKRCLHYGIRWGVSGGIVCNLSDEYHWIKPNHLKSIIRRDYISEFGNHPGLDKIIADVIEFGVKMAKNAKEFDGTIHTVKGDIPT
jgi:hypothetical protein